MSKFLLEAEVAERLGRSVSTVRRLRLTGRLAYIPGRPVLIDESDLKTFIASQTANRQMAGGATANIAGSPKTARRARQKWLARKLTGRST